MCLFAVGIDPTPEKPAEYISPHMSPAPVFSFSVSLSASLIQVPMLGRGL